MFAVAFFVWEAQNGQHSGTDFVAASVAAPSDAALVAAVVVWCGVVVNSIASFLQVGGQQAIGPARAQVVYAVSWPTSDRHL